MLAGIRDVAQNLMLRNLKEFKSEAQMRQNQWEKFLQNRHVQGFSVLLRNGRESIYESHDQFRNESPGQGVYMSFKTRKRNKRIHREIQSVDCDPGPGPVEK